MCVDMTDDHDNTPYLIVRDTNVERALEIGKALRKELFVDVEIQRVDFFLPRNSEDVLV
jgi:hypothetical protein